MLPSKKLSPYYKTVTWLFVTRNFKNDDKDREAARTHDRFSITSWPQLLVFDPRNDDVLSEMPRKLGPFEARLKTLLRKVPRPSARDLRAARAIGRAREQHTNGNTAPAIKILEGVARRQDGVDAWLEARELMRSWGTDQRTLAERLADPDVRERALAVEEIQRADVGKVGSRFLESMARALLNDDEHLIVRVRVLEWLRTNGPESVTAGAVKLLKLNSDRLRYGVLEVIEKHPDPKLGPTLAAMFKGAGTTTPSRNPNVLRARLAAAMRESGDQSAVDALAVLAREAAPNNGTTRTVLDVLASIAGRIPRARPGVVAVLLDSFPAGEDEVDEWLRRRVRPHACAVLAALHKASGKQGLEAPPRPFTKQACAKYVASLRKTLRRRVP
ncbi:MAG: hypothetical protein GY733_20315 [bacterium]|nr:hypothetical protein [bacterium]